MDSNDKAQLHQYLKKAQGKGISKVYLHWTAGRYYQVFNDYHICVKGDGEVYFTTEDFTEVLAHTWQRNTKAIGIALCCCFDAQFPNKLGTCPPTTLQIEHTAQAVALICRELNIPITIKQVMTHAEAADNLDGGQTHAPYGPKHGCEKWDLYQLQDYDGQWNSGGDVIRGKALWYLQNGV